MELVLRPYQNEALNALYDHLRTKESNPALVLPTGAGKGVILAQLARDVVAWHGRIVILAHVKELLEQTAKNILTMAPEIPIGIYSAGLKSRDIEDVTIAGIQSVYERAEEFGPINVIAVDEAHRIPPDGEGMYQTFIQGARKVNPDVRIVGLTATPYRTQSGVICRPGNILNEVCYEVSVKELIVQKHLSPLRSKAGREKPELSGVHIRGGEFIPGELEQAMMSDERKVAMACLEIAERTQNRKSVLVFACGVDHAEMVARMLADFGPTATVFGHTPSDERARAIAAFRAGEIKYLVNVEVLTIGFDAPGIDCVAILRPTMSPGLWYQMCGRGFRNAAGKENCLVLDFGDNVKRHGTVDAIQAPEDGKELKTPEYKECPVCQESVPYGCEVCPDCGNVWVPEKRQGRGIHHNTTAGEAEVVSSGGAEEYEVLNVTYHKHFKKGAPEGHPPTLWVKYDCGIVRASEFICLEHSGFARSKAEKWWKKRSGVIAAPGSVDLALEYIACSPESWMEPTFITLEADGKYLRVVGAREFVMRKAVAVPSPEAPKAAPEDPTEQENTLF